MESEGGKNSQKYQKSLFLKLVTYNIRILSSNEKLLELEAELKGVNWDVLGLAEVRRRDEGWVTLKPGHVFYYAGNIDDSYGGIGLLINKRHYSNIVRVKKISPRVV